MSVDRPGLDSHTEPCSVCRCDTLHTIRIEIRTESRKTQNAAYSREPYRVSTCQSCGDRSVLRMNNA